MSEKKTVAINTVVQIIGKLTTGATTFFISILLARSLGVDGYGDFIKITTYIAFFYLFCDFGLNAAYLQLTANGKYKNVEDVLFTVRSILGLALMFFCLTILVFLPGNGSQGYAPTVKLGIILFVPTILFQSLITTTNAFFQRKLRYDYATYALIAGSITTLVLVFCFSYLFQPTAMLFTSLLAFLIGSGITTIAALLWVRKIHGFPRLIWNKETMKRLCITALPLGLTLIFNVIYFHADSFILTIYRSTEEVGIYGLAYKFFELILVVPTFFMNAVLPLLVDAHALQDKRLFRTRTRLTTLVLVVLSLVIGCVSWICSPLIPYIRPEFAASILPFRLFLISLPIFYVTAITMWLLVLEQKRKQLLIIYGTSMIMNIAANCIFIPIYGYMAAAWITIASEAFVLITSWFCVRSLDSIK